MLSRPASIFAAAAVAALSLAACSSHYNGVYSYKKNAFVAPAKPEVVKLPNPNSDALPGSQIGAHLVVLASGFLQFVTAAARG